MELQTGLKDKFRNLDYSEVLLVDNTKTRFLIDDVSIIKPESLEEVQFLIDNLILSSRGELRLVPIQKMFSNLNISNSFNYIFPGEGSKPILDYINSNYQKLDLIDIFTEKTRLKKTTNKQSKDYVIFDDVIVSGETIQTIKRKIDPNNKFNWTVNTLMCLSPLRINNIYGFDQIETSIIYQGTRGIPAVNSLSTLLGNTKKSQTVLEKYVIDFVENEEVFINSIKSLKNIINYE